MTTATDDPLLLALDRLTIDHTVRVPVEDGPDYFATHNGLIPQLRAAVASNLGGGSGAGAAGNERVPIDADALVKYQQLEEAISARHQALVGGPSGLYPENDLRWWYSAFTRALQAGTKTDTDYRYELRTLEGWIATIENKFDGYRREELVGRECPSCGFSWFIDNSDRNDLRRKTALIVYWREGELEHGSYTECGCCKERWQGLMGARFLAYGTEEHDTPTNEDAEVSGQTP